MTAPLPQFKGPNTIISYDPNDAETAQFLEFLESCGLPHELAISGTLTSDQLESAGIDSYYITSLSMMEPPSSVEEVLLDKRTLSPTEARHANELIAREGSQAMKALLRQDACPGGMSGILLWKNINDISWSHTRDVYVERSCDYSTYTEFGFTPDDLIGIHYTDAMMPEAGRQVGKPVVSVECDNWHGSAVIIGTDGTLITAEHVLYDVNPDTGEKLFAPNPYIEFEGVNYPFSEADVIISDTTADLAVIRIPALARADLPQARIAKTPPESDSTVMVVGFPAVAHRDTFEKLYTPGTYVGVENGPMPDMRGESYIHTETKFHSGNSGGAVFNHRGELIGIVSATLPGGENYSGSIIIDSIQNSELKTILASY